MLKLTSRIKKEPAFDLDHCFVLLHCSCESSLGTRVECSRVRGRMGLFFGGNAGYCQLESWNAEGA